VRGADNLTAICEPIVLKMWEPRFLTPLWAFTPCYRDSFTFTFIDLASLQLRTMVLSVIIRELSECCRMFVVSVNWNTGETVTFFPVAVFFRLAASLWRDSVSVVQCCPTFLYIGAHLTDGCGGAGAVWRWQ
jgi:hypothetical protein